MHLNWRQLRLTGQWAVILAWITVASPLISVSGDDGSNGVEPELWKDAFAGQVVALHNVGLAYEKAGRLMDAATWYRLAAERGFANSQANLALMYERGLGVPKDSIESMRLYGQAANQGHPLAQYNFARLMLRQTNALANRTQAEQWLTRSADQGLTEAQLELGYLYLKLGAEAWSRQPLTTNQLKELDENKNGLWELHEVSEYRRAHTRFQLAAKQTNAAAEYAIGCLFHEGKGVARDPVRAAQWFGRAALSDLPNAHYNLACLLQNELLNDENALRAFTHYLRAAKYGHAQAQYNLGLIYYEGRSSFVGGSFPDAWAWWKLAAEQNVIAANEGLMVLNRSLSPIERLAGDRRLAELTKLVGKPTPQITATTFKPTIPQSKQWAPGYSITEDGYILTSASLLNAAKRLQVITPDGVFDAKKVDMPADPFQVGLIKVEGRFAPLPITTAHDLKYGQNLLLLGYRQTLFGDQPRHPELVPDILTSKVISVLGRQADPRFFTLEGTLLGDRLALSFDARTANGKPLELAALRLAMSNRHVGFSHTDYYFGADSNGHSGLLHVDTPFGMARLAQLELAAERPDFQWEQRTAQLGYLGVAILNEAGEAVGIQFPDPSIIGVDSTVKSHELANYQGKYILKADHLMAMFRSLPGVKLPEPRDATTYPVQSIIGSWSSQTSNSFTTRKPGLPGDYKHRINAVLAEARRSLVVVVATE